VTSHSSSNSQGAATIYVVSPRKFKWTTTGGTNAYGSNDDAIGGFIHKPAKTGLRIGDEVRVVGHGINGNGATHNGLQTVVTSADDGATLTLTYTIDDHGHGVTAGYIQVAEKHKLSTGDLLGKLEYSDPCVRPLSERLQLQLWVGPYTWFKVSRERYVRVIW